MKDTYHHGDLKNALIGAGLQALEDEGIEGISIRSLAKQIGVSKTAPYRHFSTKEDFLGALSNEGFHQLYQRLEMIFVDGSDAFKTIGREYMTFAEDNPILYRLMFSPLMCRLSDEDSYWARKTLGLFCLHMTGQTIPDTASTGNLVSSWAYLHGLVTLHLDNIYPDFYPEPNWQELAEKLPLLK